MDDLQNAVFLMATKLSVHNSKPLCNAEVVTVRCRHVVKHIPRRYVMAYILSLAQKQCLNLEKESFSFLSYVPEVWTSLVDVIRSMNSDNYDFGYIQTVALESLKKAIKLCHDTIDKTLCQYYYSRASLNSLNLLLDTHSIVNRRRRQEDRWFAVADLLSYVPSYKSHIDQSYLTDFSPITAFGIFDGHNGPEVAEHCSHLTPYLLSLELQRHILSSSSSINRNYSKCIPDILAEIFHRLNKSVNSGRAQKFWNSGTTATICAFAGDTICTAWVGDSQAWLIFPYTNDINDDGIINHNNILKSNFNCCNSSVQENKNNDRTTNTISSSSFYESPERMSVLMEIPSSDKNLIDNNNTRVIKSTSLNIMPDRLSSSLCNGSMPTSQSASIIEKRHHQKQNTPQSAIEVKHFTEDSFSLLMDQENSMHNNSNNNDEMDINEYLGIALTDCLHRPESPSEFVSILRTGGSILTEVGSENSSSVENKIFYSHSPKDSMINLAVTRGVKENTPNNNCFSKCISIPPLDNPSLVDCRVGCLSSVSRSIGDDETAVGLNALPSITIWSAAKQQQSTHHRNKTTTTTSMPLCLIMASDGLWDVPCCSGPEISLMAWHWYKEHIYHKKECKNHHSFSEFLVNLAVQNGASDNITCSVIWLHKWKPTKLKGWTVDCQSLASSSLVRWPRHSRVTSLVNVNSPTDIFLRGPRKCIPSKMPQFVSQRSYSLNNIFDNDLSTPRYSSPPRDLVYHQPDCISSD
ncbi:unnamed protein product [Schistosoma bovis]|nr:unnamed protein product [Schistosoma bovis]